MSLLDVNNINLFEDFGSVPVIYMGLIKKKQDLKNLGGWDRKVIK